MKRIKRGIHPEDRKKAEALGVKEFIVQGLVSPKEIVEKTGKVVWGIPHSGGYLHYFTSLSGQLISLAGFVGLCLFVYFYAKGNSKEWRF